MSNAHAVEDATLPLEQEIVAALSEPEISSGDLSALVERTEVAIAEADQAAETARQRGAGSDVVERCKCGARGDGGDRV